MRFILFLVATGLASAIPLADSEKRQLPKGTTTPAPRSPESMAQASAIIQGLAKGLQEAKGIPFSGSSASALDGIVKGLEQVAKGGKLQARQLPVTPAPGSPESFTQAASIIGGLAEALKGPGMAWVPYASSSGSALDGIAKGLQQAAKAEKSGKTLAARQAPNSSAPKCPTSLPGMASVPAPGTSESYAQASGIMGGLADGLKDSMPQISGILQGLADGLARGAKGAKGS